MHRRPAAGARPWRWDDKLRDGGFGRADAKRGASRDRHHRRRHRRGCRRHGALAADAASTDFSAVRTGRHVLGGNSRSGENEMGGLACPAGRALPAAADGGRSRATCRQLLADLGVLQARSRGGGARLRRALPGAAVPQERLYIQGLWQDGVAAGAWRGRHKKAIWTNTSVFDDLIEVVQARTATALGTKTFAIPSLLSSTTGARAAGELDKIDLPPPGWCREGFDSSLSCIGTLDYGCRDDYGARLERHVSAWAGHALLRLPRRVPCAR